MPGPAKLRVLVNPLVPATVVGGWIFRFGNGLTAHSTTQARIAVSPGWTLAAQIA